MWGVWGEHGCVRVWVCPGVRGDLWVCAGVHGCGSGQKGGCAGVHGRMHVYGMNFQNFFWRIESLHQRTLIRILYEFFQQVLLFPFDFPLFVT